MHSFNDNKNQLIYNKYFNLIKDEHNVYFGGRMGSYKYLNMDQTIDLALELISVILPE
jgi:UDP-galactopyranose mutase